MSFLLTFVTPEGIRVDKSEVTEVTVPAFRGEIQFLPGHAHFLTTIEAGSLKFQLKSGESQQFFVSGGYCQVGPESVEIVVEEILDRAPEASELIIH